MKLNLLCTNTATHTAPHVPEVDVTRSPALDTGALHSPRTRRFLKYVQYPSAVTAAALSRDTIQHTCIQYMNIAVAQNER